MSRCEPLALLRQVVHQGGAGPRNGLLGGTLRGLPTRAACHADASAPALPRALVAAGLQYFMAVLCGEDHETLELLATHVMPQVG
ncbi:MAG TPA: hypothetical protein VFA70_12990 [Dehalococcoidia bacterium]|nr:hypothetical protein [Dehalococcoidia bacterium]